MIAHAKPVRGQLFMLVLNDGRIVPNPLGALADGAKESLHGICPYGIRGMKGNATHA